MKNIPLDRCVRVGLILLVTGIFQIPLFAQMSDMPEPAAAQAGDLNVGFNRPPSAEQILNEAKAEPSPDLHDHLAKIYQVFGDVKILKKGQAEWAHAFPNMTLEVGDQILTGSDSYLDIAYDAKFLNVARIQANTKAEFRSIEPTDLVLEDGSIFNVLDGLNGERYQISTPTAVAGVRGTTFLANSTGVFDVYPDKSEHVGEIYVELKEGGQTVDLVEGQTFDAAAPDQGITDIPQERIAGAEEMLNMIDEFRTDSLSFGTGDSSNKNEDDKEDSTETDQNKMGDGPNDDGDGSDLKESDSTDPDSLDSMSKDSEMPSGEDSEDNTGASDRLADNLIPKNENQKTDMNAVVDFFAAGGMDVSGNDFGDQSGGTSSNPDLGKVLENMGMEDMGEKFESSTDPKGNYEPTGGETDGTMDKMGETYTFDSSGTDMGTAGYTDPGSAGFDPGQLIDPQTFLPGNTTTEIVQEAIKEETQGSDEEDSSAGSDDDPNVTNSGG